MTRRILVSAAVILVVLIGFARPAAAHNSLVFSDPADGAPLSRAPTQITLTFAKSVPLDTLTVELIDPTGVRRELPSSKYGPGGDTEVVTPLPVVTAGQITIRWRVVGPDGHPVTGRIALTIPATAPASPVAALPPVGAVDPVAATGVTPAVTVAVTGSTVTVTQSASADGLGEPYRTGDVTRWFLRLFSYLAIMVIGGVIATSRYVWSPAWTHPVLRRAVVVAVGAVAVLALVQLLVVASDIRGVPPFSAWSGISAAFSTDAGVAFGVRFVLAVALGWVTFSIGIPDERTRWLASGAITLVLLGTWAYAGHSQSMRWAIIGIPLDVAHHAAAAAWLGGMAILGLVAMRETSDDELVDAVQGFAWLAPKCVGVLVGTGIVQTFRLEGSPLRLFSVNHGQFLILKLVVLGVMLKVADINRRRVTVRFRRVDTTRARSTHMLRRAMGTELAIGLAVIGVTAAMVVSPPAVAQAEASAAAPTTTVGSIVDTTAPVVAPATSTTIPVSVATNAAAPANCTIVSTLQLGATGVDVTCLQQSLNAQGFLQEPATGTFDEATDQAVRAFQQAQGLVADGIVGPVTATALGIATGA